MNDESSKYQAVEGTIVNTRSNSVGGFHLEVDADMGFFVGQRVWISRTAPASQPAEQPRGDAFFSDIAAKSPKQFQLKAATDAQVREWCERHDLFSLGSHLTDARAAFEDAQSLTSPSAPKTFDRTNETPRRRQAVEALLQLGWTYHDANGWTAPSAPRLGVPAESAVVCTECYEPAERPVCRNCVSQAQHCASQQDTDAFKAITHELFAGLSDCLIDIPDEWHEKPIARFTMDGDAGDASVGMPAVEAWVLTADQAGTVLGDLIASLSVPPVGVQS